MTAKGLAGVSVSFAVVLVLGSAATAADRPSGSEAVTPADGPSDFEAATASGGMSCKERLDNNVYRCHVKPDFGGDFDDCFRFTNPGVQSPDFDLNVDLLGIVQGCDCAASGSPNHPHFGESKEFHCVTTALGGYGIAFRGEVTGNGNKIKKGQVIDEIGASYVYECELDPGCSVPFTARASAQPGRAVVPYGR